MKTLIKGVTYRQFNTNYAKSSKPLVFYEVSYLLLFRGSFGNRKNDDGGGGIHSRRGGPGGDDDNESVTKSNGLKPKRKGRISESYLFFTHKTIVLSLSCPYDQYSFSCSSHAY